MPALLMALALGAAACGDSGDDESGQKAAQADTDQAAPGTAGRDDKAQIAAVLRALRKDFNAGDGPAFCSNLATAGERQVLQFGRAYKMGSKCTAVVEKFSGQVERGQLPVKVLSVKVTGDKAIARMRGGVVGGGVGPVRLLKEGDAWGVVDPLTAQNRAQATTGS